MPEIPRQAAAPAVPATPASPPLRIPISKPWLGEEEWQALRVPLETGWVVQGPKVKEFEGKFAAFTGARHAAAATSCTTALHLAVAALGLKPGDEVVVPAFTWISTANVVEYMGARPVFVDVEPATMNLDPSLLEEAVTERTVGLLPVHLFGLAADMDPINRVARRHGLWVVEDAACGFGSWYKGEHAGTLADAGCFSFHPRKAITTGEGGMVTTDREDLDARVRSLRDHGADRTDLQRHTAADGYLLPTYSHVGYNYRMTDLQGAVGSVQMDRAQAILERRRAQAQAYDEGLEGLAWMRAPHVPPGLVHGWQSYVAWFGEGAWEARDAEAASRRRNRVMAWMEGKGVSTRQGTHAAALQALYRQKYSLRPEDHPVAHAAEQLTLSLPLYHTMTPQEQAHVLRTLREAYGATA